MNAPLLRQHLERSGWGVALDDRAVGRLARFEALLERWNRRINLTRLRSPEEVLVGHFLDSLAVVPHLGSARSLIDVGAGAGFPGMVLAVARPDLAVTLVESVGKKAAFLEALQRELGLEVEVIPRRVEEVIASGRRFDVAVSRATFEASVWVTVGRRLVHSGGLVVAMLGREDRVAEGVRWDYALPGIEERALRLIRD